MVKFYSTTKLILLQILCLQCSYYLAQGLLLGICHGTHVTLNDFFAYYTQTISTIAGLKNVLAIVAASLVSALGLMVFVERAKKCLDFGVTLYFIDFLAQCFYSEFPKMWDWWFVHIMAAGVTVVLGEYLCSRRELEDIPMAYLFTKDASRQN
ncbi:unnamed protein product [Peronospora effusa]|uniref:Uncharacterized protein n=1 Tax=Peronospora effusa TaxID=542832 RepID=A0A3M6VSW3_9STRA|nr:hypothetical protein DD238_006582 [Peronospora effusa]CAI5702878.1 unnamed protein product [Peronospora effusa]